MKEWQQWYNIIITTFGYDSKQDQYATDVLSQLLEGTAIPLLKVNEIINGKPVLVLGAGPSLEEDLKKLLNYGFFNDFVLVSADGATTALLEITGKVPDIIITDLDACISDLFKANAAGATMVIHGHGDNIPLLRHYVSKFKNKIGTTQTVPRPNVYNFGGFTDGDRAVFLSTEMKARIIVLAGMDFGGVIGKYSKPNVKSPEVKKMKLKMGKALLGWLSTKTNIPLYNITSHGEDITGFKNITVDELLKMI